VARAAGAQPKGPRPRKARVFSLLFMLNAFIQTGKPNCGICRHTCLFRSETLSPLGIASHRFFAALDLNS
jgi:hypothetical protein